MLVLVFDSNWPGRWERPLTGGNLLVWQVVLVLSPGPFKCSPVVVSLPLFMTWFSKYGLSRRTPLCVRIAPLTCAPHPHSTPNTLNPPYQQQRYIWDANEWPTCSLFCVVWQPRFHSSFYDNAYAPLPCVLQILMVSWLPFAYYNANSASFRRDIC